MPRTQDDMPGSGRARFYTVASIGDTRELTPEGFLLCRDVPLARTGELVYAPGEVPVSPGPDGYVRILRSPEEVFRPETLASFNGKPFTIDHPPEFVDPANWGQYARGVILNPRQGTGTASDCMVGDILVTDADAIKSITSGKIEVSCGYDADYREERPGLGYQFDIIGNHAALVEAGRCGPRCAIGDTNMATGTKKSWKDAIKSAFGKTIDELPDPTEEEKGEEGEADKTKSEDRILAAMDKISRRMDAMDAKIADMAKAKDEEPKKDEDGDDDEDDGSAKTTDAAEFRDVIARAEMIASGIKLPVFDAKATAKATNDALCALRRSVLMKANDGETVRMLTGGADIKGMTCDAVAIAFRAASEIAKASIGGNGKAATKDVKRTADVNTINREFWAKRNG